MNAERDMKPSSSGSVEENAGDFVKANPAQFQRFVSCSVLVRTGVFDTLRPGAHPGGTDFRRGCNSVTECEVSILITGV